MLPSWGHAPLKALACVIAKVLEAPMLPGGVGPLASALAVVSAVGMLLVKAAAVAPEVAIRKAAVSTVAVALAPAICSSFLPARRAV